jgi:branched-chain amino acid transport system ATP-binding protein
LAHDVAAGEPLLQVREIVAGYGSITGVGPVSFTVNTGESVGVLGANGAGKSTLLRVVSGVIRAWSGQVTFAGEDITRLRSDQRVRRGLVHVPEGRRVLPRLTVGENLRLGAFVRRDGAAIRADLDGVLERFPRLGAARDRKAGALSGGEQQMLAIGRAMMARPRMLLLDEPSLGLSPLLVHEVFALVGELISEHLTVLLVEQNVKQGLQVADRAYVLSTGEITASGPAAELLNDDALVRSYLGGTTNHGSANG